MSVPAIVDVADESFWHLWRAGGVGGSDVAALIGLSNYSSPVSLFYEKVGQVEPSGETQRQRIGKRMEHVLAAEFHDLTGRHVVGEQTWCELVGDQWARCTADGFDSAAPAPSIDDVDGTVQFKTDGRFGWPDGVPANIRAQCIWEMGVTRMPHCSLVVMFAGFKVDVFEIAWDEDAQADWDFMFARARTFWFDHVQAGVVPPMDDHPATTAALTEIYRDPAGVLEADGNAKALVYSLQYAKALTKAAEADERRWSNELRAFLGEHTELVDGWIDPGPRSKKAPKLNVLASWRPQTTRRVDLDGLRAEAPELVERHTTSTETRVLRVPKLKDD